MGSRVGGTSGRKTCADCNTGRFKVEIVEKVEELKGAFPNQLLQRFHSFIACQAETSNLGPVVAVLRPNNDLRANQANGIQMGEKTATQMKSEPSTRAAFPSAPVELPQASLAQL